MTGFDSKRKIALERLDDDDDIQVYAKPSSKRPVEADYNSHIAYARALEVFCDSLAQPAQEPVAEFKKSALCNYPLLTWKEDYVAKFGDKLYTTPPQPVQEPVAWGFRNDAGAIYDCISPEAHAEVEGDYTVPLYTTPPQRPWVGLTDDEEIADFLGEDFHTMTESEERFFRLGVQAAKEKNT